MASNGVNVVRYTALGLGVLYGFFHQQKIRQEQKAEAARHNYQHQVELINKAKAEYARLKNPARPQGFDLSDPNFDFDGYFASLDAQKA